MDFYEISELDQKSLCKQHIEKSEQLNTIHYDSACLNFCECKFLQIFADFGHILAKYQPPLFRSVYSVSILTRIYALLIISNQIKSFFDNFSDI